MEKFVKTALIGTRALVINKDIGFSLFKTTQIGLETYSAHLTRTFCRRIYKFRFSNYTQFSFKLLIKKENAAVNVK